LLLGGVAVAHHRRLDFHRAILANFDILFGGREQRDAARLAELQRALDIQREKDFFEAHTVGVKFPYDF
jgi:hypothetical protein